MIDQSVSLGQSVMIEENTRENTFSTQKNNDLSKQISVLRSSSRKLDQQRKESNPWLTNHPFSRQKTYLKDIEIFYDKEEGEEPL
mmetsp:Transcript_19288/g.18434  ORF Transcript_19288/g.18434 Transcript_19288/m.18434 type:complete len:85 (+) Transcript_19288:25-279(+)|eukprot:CAMPEP_0170552202 /NCGR_PEP_ID=MMETSP0211-20121228/10125_1 /TAXON_ID=311385 /ORGANISM="Pseudokeronopsis sp., Strain OXSARD2" /LENGTH=84 /DNA_ID=CAMNT_0010859783 /DNA_START=270 /DNA_END=524 /DNA_ORIENTATION=-